MRIGVPRETKDGERRVAMVPGGVRTLVQAGHAVIVEGGAGQGSGFPDADYRAVGARIADGPDDVWRCELVVKVKELQPPEYARLVRGTTVFGFAQLNRDRELLDTVLAADVRLIAYELVRDAQGAMPLLAPMSRIAGRLAPLVGARILQTDVGGNGTLLTGAEGIAPARVLIIGAGNVGREAARIAAQLGCRVTVGSRGAARLTELAHALAADGMPVTTMQVARAGAAFDEAVADADLLIGAVLEPGTLSPKLVSRRMLATMRAGSALVDVGIDQGGIAASSRMTTLSQPTYIDEGVVHYAVPNMPALVARTASCALAIATLPYVGALAGAGVIAALDADPGLAAGVMVWDGSVVQPGLAAGAGVPAVETPWRASAGRPRAV